MFHHLMNRFAVFVIGFPTDDPDRRGERRGDRPGRGDVPGWALITLVSVRAHTCLTRSIVRSP